MSGTSLDSADYALCSMRQGSSGWSSIRLQNFWQVPIPRELRNRLGEAAQGISKTHEVAQLHHDLGRFFAMASMRVLGPIRPDVVGIHGQTVFHNPAPPAATFQLGEPAYLVEMLGVPVVSNFRAADLAAGGQGAPIATLFHRSVFGQRNQHVCVNNLGGISNVTSIDWNRRGEPDLMAFDTGPANMMMDLALQIFTDGKCLFDRNGDAARRGTPSQKILAELMRHPFLRQSPPKSTGREVFGEAIVTPLLRKIRRQNGSIEDLLATFTVHCAKSIRLNYEKFLPGAPNIVILSGGGARNRFLVETIAQELHSWNSWVALSGNRTSCIRLARCLPAESNSGKSRANHRRQTLCGAWQHFRTDTNC
jgi:anhydro-N-acetylmuramic acid kinase